MIFNYFGICCFLVMQHVSYRYVYIFSSILPYIKSFMSIHHFSINLFYTPWKRQKTFDFMTFSGGIKMEHEAKIGQETSVKL